MKILRITAMPGNAAKFRKIYKLHKKPFTEQVNAMQAENLMLPGGWASEMTARGFEVMDVLYPDVGLLCRWARENGYNNLAVTADSFEILKRMVADFKPDVIFIYAGALFHITRALREELRLVAGEGTGREILIVGFWGDELCDRLYKYGSYFGDLDFVFVSSEPYKNLFHAIGIPSRDIGNSFDASIKFKPAPKKDIDVLFCGTTGFGIPEHLNRYHILKKIIPQINIKIYGNDRGNRRQQFKIAILKAGMLIPSVLWRVASKCRVGRFLFRRAPRIGDYYINAKLTGVGPWSLLDRSQHPAIGIFDFEKPLSKLFPRRFSQPLVKNSDYLNLLSRARIVLNIHR